MNRQGLGGRYEQIYIYREREREGERDMNRYIYIYIYIERERGGGKERYEQSEKQIARHEKSLISTD